MRRLGAEIDDVSDGSQAYDRVRCADPGYYDCVLMDVQMPEMNGLEATRSIRAMDNPWVSSIPIIAMTADAFSENVTECLNAGMNGHIAKPIDVKAMIKTLTEILSR